MQSQILTWITFLPLIGMAVITIVSVWCAEETHRKGL